MSFLAAYLQFSKTITPLQDKDYPQIQLIKHSAPHLFRKKLPKLFLQRHSYWWLFRWHL